MLTRFPRFVLALSLIWIIAAPTRGAFAESANIIDTAVAAGSFKTLTSALSATDLVTALKGDGPFTVFAPTDEAFAKLPRKTLQSLLRPENKPQLVAILAYHVVAGKVPAKEVVRLRQAKTLNGRRVEISVVGGSVRINGAKVVQADIQASNGVIHVIDTVLLPGKDIVETALEAGSFRTLTAALKAADLVGALQGEGPFTVFAPTDEAFAKLPKGTVEKLLRPENKALLASILTYHVVSGKVTSDAVVQVSSAKTLNGQLVDVSVDDGVVRIDGATVVQADVKTSNGVIHVVDQVLLPNTDDIIATAVKAGGFKTLAAAIEAASMVEGLRGEGPFTVFAPTDEAFAKLPNGTLELLLKPENVKKLQAILLYHVVPGRVLSSELKNGPSAKTAHGDSLKIRVDRDGVRINDSKVVRADIDATNGIIHVIDAVLLPVVGQPSQPSQPSQPTQPTHSKNATPTTEKSNASAVDRAQRLIEGAIERGVPAYNSGDAEKCASIYEMATTRLLEMPQQVLSASTRRDLQDRLSAADQQHSIRRPWSLRRGLDLAYIDLAKTLARSRSQVTSSPSEETPENKSNTRPESMLTLYDFSEAARSGSWRSVNDNVMGGVSRGGFKLLSESKSLVFSGELSLKNRGGFASIRTSGKPQNLSDFDGLAIRVRGDGRSYKMNVHTNRNRWGGSYRVEFPTKEGEWTTLRLPFNSFRAQFHGRKLSNAAELDRGNVRSIGITLADKREGDFRLEVDWIKAFKSTPENNGGNL